ncbi:uncharacterized protein HD556DRAFT_1354496 [Suillus plorans]|uniref:Secreted protein n=1 Tax=Suillus plorans TaxID=116603 RepID=A0A9P7IYV5_9AGAM|nr:uncharacterized protein HD556DRAFT_1354496 [Suillus plorans]KAG1797683.1 hypothetical protein HD556DRAFT_1354496 [Suillus plorans]
MNSHRLVFVVAATSSILIDIVGGRGNKSNNSGLCMREKSGENFALERVIWRLLSLLIGQPQDYVCRHSWRFVGDPCQDPLVNQCSTSPGRSARSITHESHRLQREFTEIHSNHRRVVDVICAGLLSESSRRLLDLRMFPVRRRARLSESSWRHWKSILLRGRRA